MKNIGQMMKKAQEMQVRMGEMEESLTALVVEGVSGGGLVKVSMTGKSQVLGVSIDPSVIDAGEPELLEDMVAAAFNDACAQISVAKKQMVDEMTDGLPLPPGMKLPF